MPPIATVGVVIEVTPWDDVYVDTGDSSDYICDRTPFYFRVQDRLEDGQLFYGLYGPVISGPPRYQGLICNIILRADGSDWRVDSVCQASFIVGPSIVTRDHREDFRHPDGIVMFGLPYIRRFGEINVVSPRAEAAPVFNLEVDADHPYRVGENGVLVHNGSPTQCGPKEPETVCHYGKCGSTSLHAGTWVTDVCGLPWDWTMSISTGLVDIKKKGTRACEYKFGNPGVTWEDRTVNGLRQGVTGTAVDKFSSTRLIPQWK